MPERDVSARVSSSPGILEAGARLGRYTIVEPLGAGGMGVVYRGFDEQLEREIALKILAPGVLSGDDAHRRFRGEALMLARLSHARIASVYDAGQHDGIDYIVMELVPGVSLATRLADGPLSVPEATSIALQIAEALEEAHERGIIHRDLKPANVMMTPKGRVKVLDFGIAKLLSSAATDETLTAPETRGIVGTPRYMSPEQALGEPLDHRTDLWNLGVLYFELLTGRAPFRGSGHAAVLRAITSDAPTPLPQLRPDAPAAAAEMVTRALEKDPAKRYQSASGFAADASALLASLTATGVAPGRPAYRRVFAISAAVLLVLACAAAWLYVRSSRVHWAREDGMPQITSLFATNKPLAGFLVLEQARRDLPASDPQIAELTDEYTQFTSVASSPAGATVAIQDYGTPDSPWHVLGKTPLAKVRIPKGYFRWKLSLGGFDFVSAPSTENQMEFPLDAEEKAPPGTVYVPAQDWTDDIGFVGWVGPYKLPAYYADRFEVTNREFQRFVDAGGYGNRRLWPTNFKRDGHDVAWEQEMTQFRDTSGRAGPATWVAGHFPEGQAEFPVTGVSWFEASAYAAFAGRSLPVLAQWFQLADPSVAGYGSELGNLSGKALAPVGAYKSLGPLGTYDLAGNAREWVVNAVDENLNFILGGSWKSPTYLYYSPEALSPFDRSDTNGFRTVQNITPMPEAAELPIQRDEPDFNKQMLVSDEVFHAHELLYAYPQTPLNAKSEGIVKETPYWREEKITFDTAYDGERMSAYLYLPKNIKPPYQTVLFFPSARVVFLPGGVVNGELGDTQFFDYVIQSGRAVMYPIYQSTYERRAKLSLPRGAQGIELTTEWYKDAARSLDYLATRGDIDRTRLAYLGVSMGSADGVILATLLQDRLKTVVFLDGGYFLDPPTPGAAQAEFAPRLKKPVLMVNGRYDFTFSLERSQMPMFNALGSPPGEKSHVVLDTPHDVTEQKPQLVKAVLDWLDHYLGRVAGQGES